MPDRYQYPELRSCLQLIKPYIPGKPVEEVERELGVTGAIKLASNENPLGPSPLALERLQRSFQHIHYYPDGRGYYLKKTLSEKWGVKEEQLVTGNGSDELLSLISQAYLNPGEEAAMVHPTFSEYEFAVYKAGGTPKYIPLEGENFEYNLEAIFSQLTERTRLVFICSPNNPTGTIVGRKELERFLDRLPSRLLVVLDEAYGEYVAGPDYGLGLDFIKQNRPVVSIRTFSKIYGLAGLRIGYAIASEKIASELNRIREPFNVNSLAQAAALAALADEKHLQNSLSLVREGKRQLARGLAELGLTPVPSEANFYFVDIKADSQKVFERLLQRGVIIRTGEVFGYPTYIRVTIGTEHQNRRFLEALADVLKEIRLG
ncbi:MAG TPA: histidinol-phosphate transaminase [Firmicutes bacterium]|nr:histidinol-phosphate transaminase [Bacillota bacterium]